MRSYVHGVESKQKSSTLSQVTKLQPEHLRRDHWYVKMPPTSQSNRRRGPGKKRKPAEPKRRSRKVLTHRPKAPRKRTPEEETEDDGKDDNGVETVESSESRTQEEETETEDDGEEDNGTNTKPEDIPHKKKLRMYPGYRHFLDEKRKKMRQGAKQHSSRQMLYMTTVHLNQMRMKNNT